MKNKRIALVHDYIKEYGGAERVLEALHEIYPHAPVFTLVYAPEFLGPHRNRFINWDIRPSFLQYIPFSHKFISIYRVIAPIVFKTFNFSGYEIIIVSATGAYQPNYIDKKVAKQICYCHTPPRYLYGYATARNQSKNFITQIFVALMNHILRMVDFISAKQVDMFVANSKNIAKRIEKFYRKESVVIYPPVDIAPSLPKVKKENFYLTGGRLARPKHVDLLIGACTQLNKPLKVFGKSFAGYGDELQHIAGSTIEFLGEVSDEQKKALMQRAKAFLFASEDEDFGIVPVEAMGQGTPVIAYRSGGVVETVVEGKTGIFFDTLTLEAVSESLEKFERIKLMPLSCYNQAKKFSKVEFVREIKKIIESV